MARVAVVTSTPPMAEGGHMVIARSLARALEEQGHQAGVVCTPQNRFGRLASSYIATWFTDVGRTGDGHPVDQVISLRYPSYAVRHPRHVCWLNHTMREYYDLWDSWCVTLPAHARMKESLRRAATHKVDKYLLTRNVTKLFVQSKTIQKRLETWGGIPSEVLYPPAPQRPYRHDEYGGYLFVVSRLTKLKRIDLVIRALARPEAAGVRCLIGGDGEDRPALERLIEEEKLGNRVTLLGRLDDGQLVEHLAKCRAVCFAPYDEDYGFVTIEAFSSSKAVVTCRDSGGPAELVRDGENGLVAEPDAEALAVAIARVMNDEQAARRMGEAAAADAARITWPHAVSKLVIV
ncbi:MAG TPA: glycosyltransferase family 4 protein [Vicinamibacterales bacterium]